MLSKPELFALIQEHGVEAFNQYRRQTEFEFLDLSQLNLTGMDLTGINLSQTSLHGAQMDFCILDDATLVYTQFIRASLREVHMGMVQAAEADFSETDLYRALLVGAELIEARFVGCDAKEANFTDADLSGAHFERAYLNDAIFNGATLSGADFTDAEMEWAELIGVKFSEKTIWSNQVPPGLPLNAAAQEPGETA